MSSSFYIHDTARTLYRCKCLTSLFNWVEEDPVTDDDRTYGGLILYLGFASSSLIDYLASLLYLGNQLGVTTTMVGEVEQDVGLVEDRGAGVSTSYRVIVLCGSPLPTVKQQSQGTPR